jgi:hypothetical protein
MRSRVRANNAVGIGLLERMYSFDQYDPDLELIEFKSSSKSKTVKITSLYTVENSWYFKANP